MGAACGTHTTLAARLMLVMRRDGSGCNAANNRIERHAGNSDTGGGDGDAGATHNAIHVGPPTRRAIVALLAVGARLALR